MKKLRWAGFLSLFFSTYLFAQPWTNVPDAETTALGYCTSIQTGAFSLMNNPAGMQHDSTLTVAIFGENKFLLEGVNTFAVAATLPVHFGAFGLGVTQFGNTDYNQQRFSFGYAKKLLPNFSVGLSFDYVQFQITEAEGVNAFTAGVGLQYQPTDEIYVGMRLFNPFKIAFSDFTGDQAPAVIALGAAYSPSEKAKLLIEVEKTTDFDLTFKAGIAYRIIPALSLRVGYTDNPSHFTAGVGFYVGRFDFAIANDFHPVLGSSPQISIQYHAK
ncbi:MAG: hypothetical protein R2798_03375 [Chitinophagales bacterium]|nr:hypothetical protein [Bacteroidota bacterium]MCB9043529.1 hypothetical protein [Chitinophagales bacterium]